MLTWICLTQSLCQILHSYVFCDECVITMICKILNVHFADALSDPFGLPSVCPSTSSLEETGIYFLSPWPNLADKMLVGN